MSARRSHVLPKQRALTLPERELLCVAERFSPTHPPACYALQGASVSLFINPNDFKIDGSPQTFSADVRFEQLLKIVTAELAAPKVRRPNALLFDPHQSFVQRRQVGSHKRTRITFRPSRCWRLAMAAQK